MRIYTINSNVIDCLRAIAYRNKYDVIANSTSQEIFKRAIINDEFAFDLYPFDNAVMKIRYGKNESIESATAFDIKAYSQLIDDVAEIVINIKSKDSFSDKDYENFIYVLYEVVRHELEHAENFYQGKYPDESYRELYDKIFKGFPDNLDGFAEHVDLISRYITCDEEIDSYAKSIYYIAKKRKVNVDEIIRQVFNRAFFNNRIEMGQLANDNPALSDKIEFARKTLEERINKLHSGGTKTSCRMIFV